MEREGDEPYRVSLSDTVILYDRWCMASSCLRWWSMRSTARSNSTIFRRSTSFGSSARNEKSERKKIEAEGIREFQQVVSQGISRLLPALARYRGDPSAFAIHELEGRDRRQRERRPAAHPRQYGYVAGTGHGRFRARRRSRGTQGHDNYRWPSLVVGWNTRSRLGELPRQESDCRGNAGRQRARAASAVAPELVRYPSVPFADGRSDGTGDGAAAKAPQLKSCARAVAIVQVLFQRSESSLVEDVGHAWRGVQPARRVRRHAL